MGNTDEQTQGLFTSPLRSGVASWLHLLPHLTDFQRDFLEQVTVCYQPLYKNGKLSNLFTRSFVLPQFGGIVVVFPDRKGATAWHSWWLT